MMNQGNVLIRMITSYQDFVGYFTERNPGWDIDTKPSDLGLKEDRERLSSEFFQSCAEVGISPGGRNIAYWFVVFCLNRIKLLEDDRASKNIGFEAFFNSIPNALELEPKDFINPSLNEMMRDFLCTTPEKVPQILVMLKLQGQI